MVQNPDIYCLIYFYRHYIKLALNSWNIYPCIVDAYFMYDFYMEKAQMYELLLLAQL